MSLSENFRKFSQIISVWLGSPLIFFIAVLIVLVWALSGPLFHYSDTWQLVINTGTTVITFLMVFVIQNTQNRDGRALQLKLDELIRVTKNARNQLIDIEILSDEELEALHKEFCDLQTKAHAHIQDRKRRRRNN